jgi:hypothetical protein
MSYVCIKHGPQEAYVRKTTNRHGNGEKIRYICKLCVKERGKTRYDRNPEVSHIQVNKWRTEHRKEARNIVTKCYHKNKEKYLPKAQARRRERRLECLHIYSDVRDIRCAICNESHDQFLCLDHIDGGGTQHRTKVGRGDKFYKWIVKSNYPSGFRVLCHNCNFKENLQRNREIFESKVWEPKTRIINGRLYPVDRKKSVLAEHRHDASTKLKCLTHYSGNIPKCSCCSITDFGNLGY